jgi:hypothetical protein
MAIRKIAITIKGTSALMMNRYPMVEIDGLHKKPLEEQAEIAAYRDETTGELYVPGINVQRALVSAATFSKGKGRASLQKIAAACLMVNPERIYLGTKQYKIDSRPVVIPATKGRVMKHRPRLDSWALNFELEYDDTLMKETEVRRIVDDMGTRVGILDFRPERKGPFGRSMVSSWKLKAS